MNKEQALQIIKNSLDLSLTTGRIKLEDAALIIAAYKYFTAIEVKENKENNAE
jgi:hypothetical protein